MRSITIALVVLLSGGTAAAQSAPAPAQSRPAFELAQATVTALTLASSIEQSIDRIDRNRLGEIPAGSRPRPKLVRARPESRGELAARPAIGAPDSAIRKAAAAMRAPFNQLSSGLNDAIRIWEKLNRVSDDNEAVDLVRSSTALLANEGPWERLGQATIGVTHALLDLERAAVRGNLKSARHLQLTKVERETVIASLKKSFPRLSRTPGAADGLRRRPQLPSLNFSTSPSQTLVTPRGRSPSVPPVRGRCTPSSRDTRGPEPVARSRGLSRQSHLPSS